MAAKKQSKKKAATKKTSKPELKHLGGRPPIFNTVPELEAAIEAYFESCWEPVMRRELTDEAKNRQLREKKYFELKDDDYVWKQVLNWQGEPVFRRIAPYTVCSLALAIGMTRETLNQYGKKEKFSDTIKRAKQIIEAQIEEKLYQEKIAAGVIFNLKNNFGWKDEQKHTHDVEENLASIIAAAHGGKTSKG